MLLTEKEMIDTSEAIAMLRTNRKKIKLEMDEVKYTRYLYNIGHISKNKYNEIMRMINDIQQDQKMLSEF